MVALGILALALVSIAGVSAGNYAASEYANKLSIATLLARSKMIDVEEEMWKDGFPDSDKELDGDFEDEEQPDFRWKASVRKIDVDISQLIGSLLGEEVNSENLGDHVKEMIGGLTGGGDEGGVDPAALGGAGGNPLAEMLKGDGIEGIFKQVSENLADSIREIELEIAWGVEGKSEESVTFVQYIVTTGRLSTPAGGVRSASPNALGNRNANTLTPPPAPAGTGNSSNPFVAPPPGLKP